MSRKSKSDAPGRQLSVRFHPDLLAAVEVEAARTGESRADVINRWLRERVEVAR